MYSKLVDICVVVVLPRRGANVNLLFIFPPSNHPHHPTKKKKEKYEQEEHIYIYVYIYIYIENQTTNDIA